MIERLLAGDRRSLGKAITLVESTRPQDEEAAQALLQRALPHTGNSVRIGITGSPGVGKSTFIEAFGSHLISLGHRVAVLAVDPSSPVAGGSILGDKTRMQTLSRDAAAFIRPSPAGRTLGGVARRTQESVLLCEAAGYDIIIVETVGVGQSEYQVASMVDFFLVLMLPSAGDELQGLKKGILELADALVVNKADGDSQDAAERTARHYRSALHLLTHADGWEPPVLTCSALEGRRIDEVWHTVARYVADRRDSGAFEARRSRQRQAQFQALCEHLIVLELTRDPHLRHARAALEEDVRRGALAPYLAAQQLVGMLRQRTS